MFALGVFTNYTMLISKSTDYTFDVCVFLRVVYQFFGGSTIFWTACISIYLYRCVFTVTLSKRTSRHERISQKQDKILMVFFHLISWGTPFVFCVLLIVKREVVQDKSTGLCFPKGVAHVYNWFLPLCVGFTCSLIVYLCLMVKLRSSMTWMIILKGFREQTLSLPFRISLYLLVFIVCWALDFTQYFVITFNYDEEEKEHPLPHMPNSIAALVTAAYVLKMSQGTLDTLVYGVANKEVRKTYSDKLKLCFVILIFAPILVIPCLLFGGVRGAIRRVCERYGYEKSYDIIQ